MDKIIHIPTIDEEKWYDLTMLLLLFVVMGMILLAYLMLYYLGASIISNSSSIQPGINKLQIQQAAPENSDYTISV